MKNRKNVYTGTIESILAKKILLSIDHLKDGRYILTIVNNNRVIKEVTFLKSTLTK